MINHSDDKHHNKIENRNMSSENRRILVGVIMGSQSDWATMQHCAQQLELLQIPHACEVVSAHRTPDKLFHYAENAADNGIKVIIAGAGGAAHLPGMVAAKTHLPVIGVPVQSQALNGLDSLLSMVQMPAGIAVATVAIGKAGAINAAILAASMLANEHPEIKQNLLAFRTQQTQAVIEQQSPLLDISCKP